MAHPVFCIIMARGSPCSYSRNWQKLIAEVKHMYSREVIIADTKG